MRIAKFLILLILSTPCWATWSLVNRQHTHIAGGGSGTWTTTVNSTTANDLYTIGICNENNTINVTLNSISDNKSSSWTICGTACNPGLTNHGGGTCAAAYVLAGKSGVTSVTFTMNNTQSLNVEWREYSGNAPFTFDVAAANDDASCTTCAGTALIPTSLLDLIIQEGSNSNSTDTVTAISGSYGNLDAFCNATCYGAAEWLNVNSLTPTTPDWTTTSSHSWAGFAMAFTETAAALPVIHPRNPVETY